MKPSSLSVSDAMWRGRAMRKIGDLKGMRAEDVELLSDAADGLIAELVVSSRQAQILDGLLASKMTQAHRDQVFADAEPIAKKIEAGTNLVMSGDRQLAALAAMLNRATLRARLPELQA